MTPYSAIEHLALGIFGARRNERIICMISSPYFVGYWDESGTDPGTGTKSKSDMPILLVGGYLAHVREWETFENRWKVILEDNGLALFHMKDFANRNRPYNSWPDEKYDALIAALLDVIADCPRLWVAWAIEVDVYMEIIKARNLLETDIIRAYHICAKRCLETVHSFAFVAGYEPKILHIFDRGNAAWSSFEASFTGEMLDALNILQPIAQSKTDVVPLQAADILAHQVAKNVLVSSGRAATPQRLYTKRLFGKPGLYKHIDVPELKKLYSEELAIEQALAEGLKPRHIVRNVKVEQTAKISEFFREPEDYRLNTLTRELQ
ncbi:MAG: DUF3800 domain-containing protein [Candidatus Acidiferrales bacterium]